MNTLREHASSAADPHAGQPVLTLGPALEKAAATLIMIHGRCASAESILGLYPELNVEKLAAVAPQAAYSTWYPHSFLTPMEQNQPLLDSALKRIGTLVDDLTHRGVPPERIALLGFSQGACLASEFVARNPRRYGGVMILTGGLIGPPGTPRNYAGLLDGTPVFIGANDPDPHIPWARVVETEATLRRMGAAVELRRYPGVPHTVVDDEIDACRTMLQRLVGGQ
jgi:predicted esterase